MTRRYSSTAQPTTLSAGCTSSATTIQVTATTGFPAVDFVLALDYGAAGQELVLVTNVAGTTLTVTRGYNSTPAAVHALGAAVRHVHAAQDFTDSRTHEAATSGVHGIAGSVVGTTDTQTLTGKTIDASVNTLNGFTASKFLASDGTGKAVASAKVIPSGVVVGDTDAQTLTNKTINLSNNTLLGTLIQLSTAVTDDNVAGLDTVQTLTNKTLTAPSITNPAMSATQTNLALSVTPGTGVTINALTGYKFGGFAFINGSFTITSARAAGDTLCSGLPIGYTPAAYDIAGVLTSSVATSAGAALLNTSGAIKTSVALGTATFLVCFAVTSIS